MTNLTDAAEKYSKHIKVIFKVDDKKTDDWQTPLGYPIEFIPLSNPYELNTGDNLKVKLIRNGKPLANQLVYADCEQTAHGLSHKQDQAENTRNTHDRNQVQDTGHNHPQKQGIAKSENHDHENDQATEQVHSHARDHSHKGERTHDHADDQINNPEHGHNHDQDSDDTEANHEHTSGTQLRTDSDGTVNVKLEADGIWYLRTINLINSDEAGLNHESNWATMTFEVTNAHGANSHSQADRENAVIPSYLF